MQLLLQTIPCIHNQNSDLYDEGNEVMISSKHLTRKIVVQLDQDQSRTLKKVYTQPTSTTIQHSTNTSWLNRELLYED